MKVQESSEVFWLSFFLTLQALPAAVAGPPRQLNGESTFVLTDGRLIDFDSLLRIAMLSSVEIVEARAESDGSMIIVVDVTAEREENTYRFTTEDMPYFELITRGGIFVDREFMNEHYDRLLVIPAQLLGEVELSAKHSSDRSAIVVLEDPQPIEWCQSSDVYFGGRALAEKLGIQDLPSEVLLMRNARTQAVDLLSNKKPK